MRDLENSKSEEFFFMLEETMDKAELLQNQNSEAQQMISDLSSEISTLKKELLKKSEMIVSLNEKIEKYSERALVLKKNEELKNENESLKLSEKRVKEKAEAEVKAVKAEARNAIMEAETKVQKAIKDLADRESKVSVRESKIEWEVGQRAGKIIREFEQKLRKTYEEEQKKLSKRYQSMTIKYKSVLYISLLYGIIITIITAIQSEEIRNDFKGNLQMLGYGSETIVLAVCEAIKSIASVADYIPNETVAKMLYCLLIVLLFTVVTGIVGIGIFVAGRKYFRFFNKNQKDELTVFVCLMILAVVVFALGALKIIYPINIIFFMLIAFGTYSGRRGIVEMKDKDV